MWSVVRDRTRAWYAWPPVLVRVVSMRVGWWLCGWMFLAALLACPPVFAAHGDAAAEEESPPEVVFFGPLGVLQQHPLRQALVDVTSVGAVDQPWIRVQRGVANIWNHTTPLVNNHRQRSVHAVDAQMETLDMEAGVPLGSRLAVGLRTGVARVWGGGQVDQTIEDFHHQFDFHNFGRETAPIADTRVTVRGADGSHLAWMKPRAFLPSPVVTLLVRILEDRSTRLLVRADWQLPLGDVARALELDEAEVSTGLLLWQRFRNLVAFHLAINALWHGNKQLGGVKVQQLQWLGELGLEWRVVPHISLVMTDKLQSPLFEPQVLDSRITPPYRSTAWNAYFTPVNLIAGGARLHLRDTALTAYVGEDFMFCSACRDKRFSRETNAPDISLTLVIERVLHQSLP